MSVRVDISSLRLQPQASLQTEEVTFSLSKPAICLISSGPIKGITPSYICVIFRDHMAFGCFWPYRFYFKTEGMTRSGWANVSPSP